MNSFRFQTFILLLTSPALRATACLFYHVSSSLSSKQTVKYSPPRRKLPLPFFPQVLSSLACFLNLFALSCDSFIIISSLSLFVKYEFVKVSFNFLDNLHKTKRKSARHNAYHLPNRSLQLNYFDSTIL